MVQRVGAKEPSPNTNQNFDSY